MPAIIDLPPAAALEFELAAIETFDRMIRQIQADQYRRVQRARELAAEVDGVTPSSTSRERDMAMRSFVAELATTLGLHEVTASRLVAEAERLTGPRVATREALSEGTLSLTQVRSVLELTHGLPVEVADAVEQVALDAAAAAVTRGVVSTNAEVRRRMRRVRERLHPEPIVDRRARASDERRVCVDPAPDGMAWFSVFLEAERALAIDARLTALGARETSGDSRTAAQRAADLAADLLLGGVLGDDGRTRAGLAAGTGAMRPSINVTVPVLTLLGLDDEPADLDGYGPIDAETARRLAAHAPSMRRILVHPETGAVLSYGREHYRAPADLDGFVRYRDGRCRFPGCSRRADQADLDHTTARAHGGETCDMNLAALCRHHHRLKHESGWRMVQEPGGVMQWTSPVGHVLRTLPERPFTPVAARDGAAGLPAPPDVAATLAPPVPPDPNESFDDELRWLLMQHAQHEQHEPAPF
ncbi:HNH endonuclease signature motif containing protein [Agromyces sp. Marseille-P2726]|uniref:HNH endonuclease signature motif containing protein n=1 Tax=Agromyces sp. Marseille-P2726 TaxID=2709132 RepID=UPI00156DBA61|nr:HNH endonuclease signature motif containing protein [Agromyces sp. Marseille-P2726]